MPPEGYVNNFLSSSHTGLPILSHVICGSSEGGVRCGRCVNRARRSVADRVFASPKQKRPFVLVGRGANQMCGATKIINKELCRASCERSVG